MKVAFVYKNYENLGIEYLSAALKKENHKVKLFYEPGLFLDVKHTNKKLYKIFSFKASIIKNILSFKPNLICFSVVSDDFEWSKDLALTLKKSINVPILFGGIHPSLIPEKIISFPFIDYVCVGEGDKAIVELAKGIENKKSVNNIKNIYLKDINGNIIKNPLRPLIQNLDELPFPDKSLFFNVVPFMKESYTIMAARGCPFSCSYCFNEKFKKLYKKQKYLRQRSPENVIEELLLAKNTYKLKEIRFQDDVFTFDKKWLYKFLKLYKKNIGLPFFCSSHPQYIDDDVARWLKEANCSFVEVGIQCLDEKVRESILNRYSKEDKIISAIKSLQRNKIYIIADFLVGLPSQKEEHLEKIIKFKIDHNINFVNLFWIKYFPKSKICNIALNKKELNKEDIILLNSAKSARIIKKKSSFNNSFKKINNLLILSYFLNKKIILFLLNKKRYRTLPNLTFLKSFYLISFILGYDSDIYKKRFIKRYKVFIIKKLKDYLLKIKILKTNY